MATANPTLIGAYQVSPYIDSNRVNSAAFLLPPNITGGSAVTYFNPILVPLTIAGAGTFQIPAADELSFSFAKGQATIPAGAWNADPQSRTSLMRNFTQFLLQLETGMELQADSEARLGTAYAIGQAIAALMPCPIAESLFFRYSLSPGFDVTSVAYIDACPGMILRVETEISQYVGFNAALNGYVGAGHSRFRLSSIPTADGSSRVLAFDPFLGSINVPSVQNTAATLAAGGLIDLSQTGNLRPYVRLFYPKTMAPPTNAGSLSNNANPTLVAAQTMNLMAAVTAGYPTVPPGPPATPNVPVIFLGRATVVPEIAVWVRMGPSLPPQMEYVPLGTSLYQILERVYPSLTVLTSPSNVTLYRRYWVNPGLTTKLVGFPPQAPLQPLMNVPLFAGDVVSFGTSFGS
jgi:hypothetical protein